MSIHPRRAQAEAEAAAWLDLHSDWAAGLGDPERRSVSGDRCRVVSSQALAVADADAAERLDATDYRDREAGQWSGGACRSEGSASALGFSPWRDGWESRLGTSAPSADSGDSQASLAWRQEVAPLPLLPATQLTADHTDDHGDWWAGPLSHSQLACRQAWAAALVDQPVRRLTDYRLVQLQPESTPDWARHLLARTPRRLPEVTWVLGQSRPIERLARQQAASEHRRVELVERRLGSEVTLTGDATWPSFWAAQSFGRPALADAEPDHGAAAVETETDWAAGLAASELDAWCRERLTERQYESLTSDDLSSSTVRVIRHQALDLLERELPLHLRGLRRRQDGSRFALQPVAVPTAAAAQASASETAARVRRLARGRYLYLLGQLESSGWASFADRFAAQVAA